MHRVTAMRISPEGKTMSATAPAQPTAAPARQHAVDATKDAAATAALADPPRAEGSGAATDVGGAAAEAAKGVGALGEKATGSNDPAPPEQQSPPPTQTKPEPPKQPSVTDQLHEAHDHVPPKDLLERLAPEDRERVVAEYKAEQSAMYDRVATRLEREGPPDRDDFKLPNGKVMDWEYRDALAYYGDQLEEAQQGAKAERLRRLRSELAQTETGREMLEFERRAGVPIRIKTDREWKRDGEGENVLAYSAGDEGLTFRVTQLNTHVYVHEMTHQIDHRTKILAPEGDTRSKEQVIAEAKAKYEEFGLDPTEVEPIVDATYHQPDFDLTHGHTRLGEARHHRLELGGEPLTADEMREVLGYSVPRQRLNRIRDNWNDHKDEAELRRDATAAGIDVAGLTPDQIIERISARHEELEQKIVAIEQRGTRAAHKGDTIGSGLGAVIKAAGGALAGAGSGGGG
jgi:hypothetical protein